MTEFPIVELDLSKDDRAGKLFSKSELELEKARGKYTVKDFGQLHLLGSDNSNNGIITELSFERCQHSDCAADDEIHTFLKDHYFHLQSTTNFIDFETVEPLVDTLKSTPESKIFTNIDLEQNRHIQLELHEYRTELQDSRINFLDIFPS